MTDVHSKTALRLFGEVTPETRAKAKIINYARNYGTGEIRIGRIEGCYPPLTEESYK